ncbi:uncharacterized protein METZ01_LOCUS117286, partial [marine metagenome]
VLGRKELNLPPREEARRTAIAALSNQRGTIQIGEDH